MKCSQLITTNEVRLQTIELFESNMRIGYKTRLTSERENKDDSFEAKRKGAPPPTYNSKPFSKLPRPTHGKVDCCFVEETTWRPL